MAKGLETRETVLREALAQSSNVGLHGITIGGLADALGMSKSGLFAHFKSKEQLQVDVLDYAADWFTRLVIMPAVKSPRGEPRLQTLFDRWIGWDGFSEYALPGGCIFVAAAMEFDDLPDGPVRNRLVEQQLGLRDSITMMVQSAVSEGQFRTDTDVDQFAHDLNSIMIGYLFAARLLKDPKATDRARDAFARLLDHVRA